LVPISGTQDMHDFRSLGCILGLSRGSASDILESFWVFSGHSAALQADLAIFLRTLRRDGMLLWGYSGDQQ
jgi:hypothetical protein